MRKTASIVLGISSATLLFGTLIIAPVANAQGSAPSKQVCENKENPPKDAVTMGGCAAVDRKKGNCHSCHMVKGIPSGNVAPPLVGSYLKPKYPDKTKLRAQVFDATVANPRTVMPPFGKHGILSEQELDNVVEWLMTL